MHIRLTRIGTLAAGILLLAMLINPVEADDTPPAPKDVQNAIDRARQYLLAQQNGGNWETVPKRQKGPTFGTSSVAGAQFGGTTALATYALLDSGMSPLDPQIAPAIEFLKNADMIGIYAIGLRCQVWRLLPQNASVRAAAKRDGALLVTGLETTGTAAGLYDYTVPETGKQSGWFDHSVSQYGVLGLWACAQNGLELPRSYWSMMDTAWRAGQLPDGAWNYGRYLANPADAEERVSMTAAGVASLYITADQISAGTVGCNGNRTDPQIERGLQWIGDHFNDIETAPWPHYCMYGIERIGVASGRKYLGKANWFARGGHFFVDHQDPDGSFGGSVANTAFGLLFLIHGRAPVVLNKLDYRPEGEIKSALKSTGAQVQSSANWNQRPRDCANLVHWMGKQTEEVLNWQVVNLHDGVDDLHDAPILYVAGNEPLKLTNEEENNLKQFIEEGGLVLFNADCAAASFTASVKKLARKLFPVPGEFTRVPPTHPIFINEQYQRKHWKIVPELLGLNNGVRELMVLIPENDPALGWEAGNELVHPEQFQLTDNIFLYAVDEKNLRAKGDTYIVRPDPNIHPTKQMTLARLQYAGPWDPEPGGWRRMKAILHNTQNTELDIQTVKLGEGKLAKFKVAHLTGVAKFKFSDPERDELQKFVSAGGTLIVDAAGGREEFARSIEVELQTMFPDSAKGLNAALPMDSPVYTENGDPLKQFDYRRFAKLTLPAGLHSPRIRGLTLNSRLAVFYSPDDLSAGVVGQDVDGINGYTPATATAIMTHLLLYAGK
jgi:hypothetical protein